MSTSSFFNATDWIAHYTLGGIKLTAEATEAISSFTMMWNFFESTLCENSASIAAFERACRHFDLYQIPPMTIQSIDECLAFWRFRYCTLEGFSHRFDRLNFRPNDRRLDVENVLKGISTDSRDKLLALMIIVYRLRNNLFHGLKTLDMLNDQVQNLVTASRCLAAILEGIPSRFIAVRRPLTAIR